MVRIPPAHLKDRRREIINSLLAEPVLEQNETVNQSFIELGSFMIKNMIDLNASKYSLTFADHPDLKGYVMKVMLCKASEFHEEESE